ncbi:hypothetical protein F5X99DRAFT_411225 [Biscogniauxia marginata]|nr:hypothetical protein F5X99DRAFT_411225 [Biscogniauxia marginata]
MDAFTEKTEYTYWWAPSLATMRAWNEGRIRRRFRDRGTQQFKVVDSSSGEIVAWAKWDPPASMRGLRDGFVVYDERGGEAPSHDDDDDYDGEGVRESGAAGEEGETPPQGPPEGANVPLFDEFFDGIKRMGDAWGRNGGRARSWRTEPSSPALTHLCTRPTYHGRGIGSALLRGVLDVADAEGTAAYLESLRPATPLYERHRFTVVDQLEYRQGGGTVVIDIMIREPEPGMNKEKKKKKKTADGL